MEELIKVENNTIEIAQDFLDSYAGYLRIQKMIKGREKEFKSKMVQAMEQCGVKSFENEYLKMTYVAPTTSHKKIIDEEKLKEDGLYDKYLIDTETSKKSYIKVTVR